MTRGVLTALGVVTDPLQAPSFAKPVDVLADDAVTEQDDAGLLEFERTHQCFPAATERHLARNADMELKYLKACTWIRPAMETGVQQGI